MTAPTPPVRRYGADEESMSQWFVEHKREITWTVAAIAVLAGGFWFYERSRSLKAQRAETAYFQARQGLASGNLTSAVTDLQRVMNRYEGTAAGAQATLTLAQAQYDQKKYKEGIDALKKAEGKAPDTFKASFYVLEAAGYEELKNFVAAAEAFKQAAAVTKFPNDKTQYQASAARDYAAGGKIAEARAIWSDLAKEEGSPMAAEARVRLGELQAAPMKI
jgi:outer membrane protein assembly factor BamD (BamD/ComL family)